MKIVSVVLVICWIVSALSADEQEGFCEPNADSSNPNCETNLGQDVKPSMKWTNKRTTIYVLYEVNFGEGFNLRRDVYMRIASLVSQLRKKNPSVDWKLVLPPWGPLYHWQNTNISLQTKIPWKTFFDVESLNLYVPVIEFADFLEQHGTKIDVIHYLQNYENWDDRHWEEKFEIGECHKPHQYSEVSDEFRSSILNSTDGTDKTELDPDWQTMQRKPGDAVGGPYIAIHLRRKDFVSGRGSDVPSLKKVARELKRHREQLQLSKVFVATDAPESEYNELISYMGKDVVKFIPTHEIQKRFMDGGIAIIDQWICAHARHFIGTHESTFSFRIQEEREILGFKPDTTFNRFCGDDKETCEQPSRWRIRYLD